jgi:MFS transporter
MAGYFARMKQGPAARAALRFVLMMGVVNLFADFTYEGGRGIVGEFLGHLGASGAIVGVVAGGGELAGYLIRSVSGMIADRTGKYWIDVWIGYAINMLCVPALALAGAWPAAAGLVVGERIGRGIRKPVMSAIIAQAGRDMGGGGLAFGINEFLDQLGATVGPLVVAYAMVRSGGYSLGFGILIVPAVVTLICLLPANVLGSHLTPKSSDTNEPPLKDPAAFRRYLIGGALMAAGFVDFALISLRFSRDHIVGAAAVSVWFAVAMFVAAIAAPVLGKLYDRFGGGVVAVGVALSAAASPLAFLGTGGVALAGAALWGFGTAVVDALLLALIASVITKRRGATTFGFFDLAFGIAWFAGSAISGVLLDHSVLGLAIFSVVLQLAAIPFFLAPRALQPSPSSSVS